MKKSTIGYIIAAALGVIGAAVVVALFVWLISETS